MLKILKNNKTHICTLCAFQTHTAYMLERHMKEHKKEIKPKCTICRLTKLPKCSTCGFVATTKFILERHLRLHTKFRNFYNMEQTPQIANGQNGHKEYKCPLCNFKAQTCYLKNRHIKLLHKKEIKKPITLLDGVDILSNVVTGIGYFFFYI